MANNPRHTKWRRQRKREKELDGVPRDIRVDPVVQEERDASNAYVARARGKY
jgi:hypothetical protein